MQMEKRMASRGTDIAKKTKINSKFYQQNELQNTVANIGSQIFPKNKKIDY